MFTKEARPAMRLFLLALLIITVTTLMPRRETDDGYSFSTSSGAREGYDAGEHAIPDYMYNGAAYVNKFGGAYLGDDPTYNDVAERKRVQDQVAGWGYSPAQVVLDDPRGGWAVRSDVAQRLADANNTSGDFLTRFFDSGAPIMIAGAILTGNAIGDLAGFGDMFASATQAPAPVVDAVPSWMAPGELAPATYEFTAPASIASSATSMLQPPAPVSEALPSYLAPGETLNSLGGPLVGSAAGVPILQGATAAASALNSASTLKTLTDTATQAGKATAALAALGAIGGGSSAAGGVLPPIALRDPASPASAMQGSGGSGGAGLLPDISDNTMKVIAAAGVATVVVLYFLNKHRR
jgi:hypothetical protein